MRLLDCGSHDGWIGRWLTERFNTGHFCDELKLYGMELHPDAAAKARERGYMEVVEAPAESAPEHFEPGSFDAVVAFELIEHVPDVPAFLDACEAMLKPEGRCYISTPDGTFGNGQNPHHLRAYRSIDLADTLRRRGRLEDMMVGSDAITVASYTPGPRKGDVAIYCGPSWMPWSPLDIERTGLGGSETAAVRVAEALSALGYVVTVYGAVEQGCFKDVILRDWQTFDPLEPRAAVISSRLPHIFDRPVAAPVRLLWAHDVDFGDALTPARAEKVDRIITLSGWHERHVRGRYPFAAEKVVRLRNGIHAPYFQAESKEVQTLGTSAAATDPIEPNKTP